ncbi:hypothetical protein L3Q82_007948 [Scortum barcoo]|uniref:Uncharacterized protein n=1 Tax=Scortum barcoo TaxID=214431 RepID=A0ACB8WK67_9TELE|nr:hypothetical protein L3Q82_007948 [Scortum barcoo]
MSQRIIESSQTGFLDITREFITATPQNSMAILKSSNRGIDCWRFGATLDLAMTNETWTVSSLVVVRYATELYACSEESQKTWRVYTVVSVASSNGA